MEDAWGKWRDRIQDRRLQPLADEYTITRQTGLVFRAFGIWHAKTKVRFDMLLAVLNQDTHALM